VLLPPPPPPQPSKVLPAAGVAVNVTTVPFVKLKVHTAPQLIPAGLLVTVPLPLPVLVTVNVRMTVAALNVAVTV
jgi:hypothetical protein